jgi:hypothetical protein
MRISYRTAFAGSLKNTSQNSNSYGEHIEILLELFGSPEGRVAPAMEVVQYQGDAYGLRQQATR